MSTGAASILYLVGAGGHARVVAEIARLQGYREIRFLDDKWPALQETDDGPVVGDVAALGAVDRTHPAFPSIGSSSRRLMVMDTTIMDREMPVLVHPRAVVSAAAAIDPGTVLMANAVVNPGSRLGRGVIINTAASVDHDCVLEDGVHVSPGAHLGGNVVVRRGAWIGIGASVRHGITIGAGAVVGAGAAVVADVGDNMVVVGVPARPRMRSGSAC